MTDVLDPAATAWVLASTAMVLLMTPALALFYGGMVRTTGVLNMMMMSVICIPLVTLVWILFGYSLVFTEGFGGIIGGAELIGLDLDINEVHGTVPTLLFVTFQLTFAIITAALVSGAIADRARFAAWVTFVPIWLLIVYVPIAHWCGAPAAGSANGEFSTTRVVWSWKSPPALRLSRSPWCWDGGTASRSSRCDRTICRLC